MRLRKGKEQPKIQEPPIFDPKIPTTRAARGKVATKIELPAPPTPPEEIYQDSKNRKRGGQPKSNESIGIKVTDTKIVLQVPPSFHAKQASAPPPKPAKWDYEEDDDDLEDEEEAEEEEDFGFEDEIDSLGNDFDEGSGEEEENDEEGNLGKRMTSRQLSIAMRAKKLAERGPDDLLMGGLAE